LYLGSVRFFKHLIVSVFLLIILGLAVSTILLALGHSEKSREIEKLNSDKNALQALYNMGGSSRNTESEIDEILEALEVLGIDNKDLVNTIYQTDRQAFSDVLEDNDETDVSGVDSQSDGNTPETGIPTDAGVVSDDSDEQSLTGEESPYAELFPHLYSEVVTPAEYMDDTGFVYLTFDDGPTTGVTDSILRYLNTHGVKATFFVMPDDTENGKNFLNSMLDNGHEIGIHSMSHKYDEIYLSVEAFLDDFNQAFNLVYEQTGYKPYLYRFPGGSINDYNRHVRDDIIAEMTRRGFVYFDWNVDSRDAFDESWTAMYNSVPEDVSNLDRAVILFHDRPGGHNTVSVIEDIIKVLLADPRGYTFSVITPETKPVQF